MAVGAWRIGSLGSTTMANTRHRGPLAYWSKDAVVRYIATNKLMVSPESKVLGHSFRSLDAKDVIAVKEHYPDDYEKIVQAFPEIGAALAREAMYG